MLSRPLLFGFGTELDHMFGSRWLIDELFKQAIACSLEIQNFIIENLEGNSFIHVIADNVDYNLNSLDGKGTFHGMGVIAAITSKGDIPDNIIISRPTKLIPVKEVSAKKHTDTIL